MINQRWVYDIILIDFSLSGSCWEMCPKINRLTVVLIINVYKLINNKNYLIFFIIRLHLLTKSLELL